MCPSGRLMCTWDGMSFALRSVTFKARARGFFVSVFVSQYLGLRPTVAPFCYSMIGKCMSIIQMAKYEQTNRWFTLFLGIKIHKFERFLLKSHSTAWFITKLRGQIYQTLCICFFGTGVMPIQSTCGVSIKLFELVSFSLFFAYALKEQSMNKQGWHDHGS